MNKTYDICIIGGGIIGASIAREIMKYKLEVVILEANPRVAMETTGGNSGFIHGGFDPTPGKLNAKLNILGKKRYKDWFKELSFHHSQLTSTVVAFNDEEISHLKILYDRGIINGIDPSELKIIDAKELQQLEPNLNKKIKKALICTSSYIIDPVELTKTLFTNSIRNGAKLIVNAKVNNIEKKDNIFIVDTKKGQIKSKIIINCAGHYADKIAEMAGYPDFKQISVRGEYRLLSLSGEKIVNSAIFMVPTIHGKGVTVCPTLDGNILIGPSFVKTKDLPKNETRLITKERYWEIGEIGKNMVPSLNIDRTTSFFSGSRAIHEESDDFYIEFAKKDDHFLSVAGMKSPAISSAPAIADYVIEKLSTIIRIEENKNFIPIEKSLIPIE